MPKLTQSEFTTLALTWIREHKQAGEVADIEITESTDLIGSGLLDSFGFVDLFLFLETQGDFKIDLTDVEPADFSTVAGLYRIAGRDHDEAHAHVGIG